MSPETTKFKTELIELCKKHGFAAVPSYSMQVSFHDPLFIIPLDDAALNYLEDSMYAEFENIAEDELEKSIPG